MITGGAVVALTGCSGKPENSPVIRKKFAEYDKVAEANTTLTADVTRLNEEVTRLSQENSELRALVPSIDGESVITKLSTLEARLSKVEGVSGDRALARATSTTSSSAAPASTTTPAAPTLDTAPLAVAPAPAATEGASVVAVQQQSTSSRPAGFKELTNPVAKKSTQVTKVSSTPEKKKVETKSAPAAPAARRGAYHTFAAGETIDQVAAKYGTTAAAILQANRLPAGARIGTGQRLYVPGGK
jgi:LysM repeat protein